MASEDLNHLGDPGAVKFGNFMNYYSFHGVEHRIKNMSKEMFPEPINNQPIVCLDIGCNSGELSCELFQFLKTVYPTNDVHMLAIDIDPILIQRAEESNKNENITYLTANIMSETEQKSIKKYLDLYQKQMFDSTFCFSVTMWIHLNNGDDGLLNFIDYITSVSRSIIIEPQPWKCYRNAQRRLKKSGSNFPLYETLKIRSEVESVIESKIIQNIHRKVSGTLNQSWNRKILCFHRLL